MRVTTSWRIDGPYRDSMTRIGTLPLRNPGDLEPFAVIAEGGGHFRLDAFGRDLDLELPFPLPFFDYVGSDFRQEGP